MIDSVFQKEALQTARQMADAAWLAIQPHWRNLTEVENKLDGKVSTSRGHYDPVTIADKQAELAMRAVLSELRPEDGVRGEEFDDTPSQSGWTWVLDPVDGTRAFVAGLPLWTTLIGLCDAESEPLIGVIDQPVLGERYLGWPGGAALEQNDQHTEITVSNCEDLREAVIATTDPFIMTPAEQGAWTHLKATARIIRYGCDAYAYARLAAGTLDMVAEAGLAPHDMAALIPVVRGAGGLACDWRGNPASINNGQLVCASSQGVLDQALISLRRSAD